MTAKTPATSVGAVALTICRSCWSLELLSIFSTYKFIQRQILFLFSQDFLFFFALGAELKNYVEVFQGRSIAGYRFGCDDLAQQATHDLAAAGLGQRGNKVNFL